MRIFGPGASVAEDLEPEYITVSRNSLTAWVTLQENNAIAEIDIRSGEVTSITSLGLKDHSVAGNGLDASNRDDEINIATWPVFGMYQPDSIASYQVRGQTFLVTANEGDSRDYDGFSEEERVKDLTLDPTAFPDAATLQENENLGRLKTTNVNGDTDDDGDFDQIFSYGTRSFSIWTADGDLVFDSGDDIAQITASALPDDFNSNNDENDSFDARSDDKGTEPEAVVLAKIRGQTYAFIGLERMGGIMIYDVTDPAAPVFVDYVSNRDFAGDAEAGTAGDLGPEGMTFISGEDSPTGHPLLVVANEVSGTTTVFKIDVGGKALHAGDVAAGAHSVSNANFHDALSLPLEPLNVAVYGASDAQAARVSDGVRTLNKLVGTTAFTIDSTANADVIIQHQTASGCGGAGDGVLGCAYANGDVVIVQGWDFYSGRDPSLIGSGQYDYQSVVTHELAHVLKLGHSELLLPTLAAGTTTRQLRASPLLDAHDAVLASSRGFVFDRVNGNVASLTDRKIDTGIRDHIDALAYYDRRAGMIARDEHLSLLSRRSAARWVSDGDDGKAPTNHPRDEVAEEDLEGILEEMLGG